MVGKLHNITQIANTIYMACKCSHMTVNLYSPKHSQIKATYLLTVQYRQNNVLNWSMAIMSTFH